MIELKELKFVDFKVLGITEREDGFGFDVKLIFADGSYHIQEKNGYETEEAAFEDRDRVVGLLYAGKYIVYEDLTAEEYFTYWLEDVKRKGLSADSYDSYKNVIYNHVIPYFNDKLLCHIKMSDVRDLYNEKMEFSPSVTRLIKTIMNTSMDYAKTHNLASYNPARGVNLPKQIGKKEFRKRVIDTTRTLNLEQIFRLIKASENTPIHMQILFGVLMGLRRSEINGLKYSDIDYINRTITVQRQLGKDPNIKKDEVRAKTFTKQEIKPKTASSVRVLNIPDYVFEEILKERKKYEKNRSRRKKEFHDDNYICCSTYGNARSKSYHLKYYKELLSECGLPNIRWHDLRTTFCTLLLTNDYSAKAVSVMMGHAKEVITLDVYTDKAQIIAEGVEGMQSFMDDVLPKDEELYKEVTDVSVDVDLFMGDDADYEQGLTIIDPITNIGAEKYEIAG